MSSAPSGTLARSPTMTSAARWAVVKSTYWPVSPPMKASWSICANHCGRRAASPSSASNGASRLPRSSSVSLTSKAITLAMVSSPGVTRARRGEDRTR